MNFASAQSYLLGLINEHASRRAPNRLDRIRAFVAALGLIAETTVAQETERRSRAEFARERYSWDSTATSLLAVFASLKINELAVTPLIEHANSS